jgi:hypothetical protein
MKQNKMNRSEPKRNETKAQIYHQNRILWIAPFRKARVGAAMLIEQTISRTLPQRGDWNILILIWLWTQLQWRDAVWDAIISAMTTDQTEWQMRTKFWFRVSRKKNTWAGGLGVRWRIILKWNFRDMFDEVNCVHMAQKMKPSSGAC